MRNMSFFTVRFNGSVSLEMEWSTDLEDLNSREYQEHIIAFNKEVRKFTTNCIDLVLKQQAV